MSLPERTMSSARTDYYVSPYRTLGFDGEPCAMAELAQLEHDFGVRLPAAYRAYLLLMGRQPDYFFDGTDCAYRHLSRLRSAAMNLLSAHDSSFTLPTNAFVFSMHQGYQFMYFLCEDGSNDPAVYHYLENDPAPKRVSERFSEWMMLCAEDKREFEKSSGS
jgi:hypothetical protein